MTSCAAELAPAKVNLTLQVLGRLPNGYHALNSLVAFAEVGDRLRLIEDRQDARATGLQVEGRFAGNLVGENLITRAAIAVRERFPSAEIPSVVLDKQLPVAAGIGGGSADAAAYLRLVCKLNPEIALDSEIVLEIARDLGADVPVCLASTPTIMSGIGDVFEVVTLPEPLPTVLVNPMCDVPPTKTADVFRALAAGPVFETAHDDDNHGARSVSDMIRDGRNDLTEAARTVVPEITLVMEALRVAAPDAIVRLSGAGPTCFALANTNADAARIALAVSTQHPSWWVRATTLGPAVRPDRIGP